MPVICCRIFFGTSQACQSSAAEPHFRIFTSAGHLLQGLQQHIQLSHYLFPVQILLPASGSRPAHQGACKMPHNPATAACFLSISKSGSDLLQGLQQHVEASHDLFDFSYLPQALGQVPTVLVQCPSELYDDQGQLQNPECNDIGLAKDGKVDGKVCCAHCNLVVPF